MLAETPPEGVEAAANAELKEQAQLKIVAALASSTAVGRLKQRDRSCCVPAPDV